MRCYLGHISRKLACVPLIPYAFGDNTYTLCSDLWNSIVEELSELNQRHLPKLPAYQKTDITFKNHIQKENVKQRIFRVQLPHIVTQLPKGLI